MQTSITSLLCLPKQPSQMSRSHALHYSLNSFTLSIHLYCAKEATQAPTDWALKNALQLAGYESLDALCSGLTSSSIPPLLLGILQKRSQKSFPMHSVRAMPAHMHFA